jgi:siderophore synthetase component
MSDRGSSFLALLSSDPHFIETAEAGLRAMTSLVAHESAMLAAARAELLASHQREADGLEQLIADLRADLAQRHAAESATLAARTAALADSEAELTRKTRDHSPIVSYAFSADWGPTFAAENARIYGAHAGRQ